MAWGEVITWVGRLTLLVIFWFTFLLVEERAAADVDAALYDGFIGDGDKARLAMVRATPPAQLGTRDFGFQDPRLPELLFRYRARNWPDTLDAAERARWDGYRRLRLTGDAGLSELTFDAYFADIKRLRDEHAGTGGRQALLDRLEDWGRELAAGLLPDSARLPVPSP